jgi:hypothetical protein
MYLPNFLDGYDRLVAFDAETTGKRTPDAEFIRKQPFAWKAPGIIIEVGLVEMLRDGEGVVKVTAIRRRVARQALWRVMIYPVRARHSANAAVRLCL